MPYALCIGYTCVRVRQIKEIMVQAIAVQPFLTAGRSIDTLTSHVSRLTIYSQLTIHNSPLIFKPFPHTFV